MLLSEMLDPEFSTVSSRNLKRTVEENILSTSMEANSHLMAVITPKRSTTYPPMYGEKMLNVVGMAIDRANPMPLCRGGRESAMIAPRAGKWTMTRP